MTKIPDAIAARTNEQVRALVTELENKTILDRDKINQGILYHKAGSKIWRFGFPANPVGTSRQRRSLLTMQLHRPTAHDEPILHAEFQHPFALTMVPISQSFQLTNELVDPTLMFVNPNRTGAAKDLLSWALAEYDEFHIRGYLRQSSTLQPESPAPKPRTPRKKPSVK